MSVISQFFSAGGNVPSSAFPIELLVVGGGGGSTAGGAGAGGGRVIHVHGLYVIPGVSYNVTVGAGGGAGANGGESSFGDQIFAPPGQGNQSSNAGGSGCGGQGQTYGAGGALPGRYNITVANDHLSSKCYFGPDTRVLDLGNPGGMGAVATGNSLYDLRGGGGGACSPGGDSFSAANSSTSFHNPCNGAGGAGYRCDIDGGYVYYGGGGNGYSAYSPSVYGSAPGGSTGAGTANTGQGAGNYGGNSNGGSGIVVVAYSSTRSAASTTGTVNSPARSNYRVYRFTGSGSITL